MKLKSKEKIVKYKLLYTLLILLVYILGRRIPLYGIDISEYTFVGMDVEKILMYSVGGDIHRCSVFTIGISPYMVSSLFVHIIMACKSNDSKAGVSPKRVNRLSLTLTLFLTIIEAFQYVNELKFANMRGNPFLTKTIVLLEMITGVMIVVWLADRNKRYGIGGQTTLIYINILEGVISTLGQSSGKALIACLLISAVGMEVIIIMENAEKRIPVQRISIHNIYADKNYLAIKLNPIGVMPVMFSAALFTVPQMVLSVLGYLFPMHMRIIWWQQNMVLTKPMGIVIYIICLYLLTIGLSILFISPGDITEQFLKSGDCIENIHSGHDTKKYLTGVLLRISFLSSTIMGVCAGVPLLLQLIGNIDGAMVILPTSLMMLTGIWCNLYREVMAIRKYDTCQPFL